MDMYTKHFCFEFVDIFKYIKNAFQIKGAYAPESKKASPRRNKNSNNGGENPVSDTNHIRKE
jgi:hypothetical protein